MDANRIVSAAAQEAASVRELYTQLSQVEFDQRMQTDLRPFFHNESALKALIQTSATHSCASIIAAVMAAATGRSLRTKLPRNPRIQQARFANSLLKLLANSNR